MKYIETGMLIWLIMFVAVVACFAVANKLENEGKSPEKKEHNYFFLKLLALAALIIFIINALCEKATYFIN